MRFCRAADIVCIKAADDYTEVRLENGELAIVAQRLRYWEAQLPETFVRIHRATLVNMDCIRELTRVDGEWKVRLEGYPELLTMSRRAARVVKSKIDAR